MSKTLGRRAVIGSALGLGMASAAAADTQTFTAGPKGNTMVYVAAWDCPPCIQWKNNYKPDFVASPQYKKLTLRMIDAHSIKTAYEASYWPEDLLPFRAYLIERKWIGVPRFSFLKDGKIVSSEWGVSGWVSKVWPSIQQTIKA